MGTFKSKASKSAISHPREDTSGFAAEMRAAEDMLDYFNAKTKFKQKINMVKSKYTMRDVVKHIGPQRTKELIDYYVRITKMPSIDFFMYNYTELEEEKLEVDTDREHRRKMREETRKRLESKNE